MLDRVLRRGYSSPGTPKQIAHGLYLRRRYQDMRKVLLFVLMGWFGTQLASAQFQVDCSCLRTQSVLLTNACQGVIPDMCQFTNFFQSTIQPPPAINCSQNPAAGTVV